MVSAARESIFDLKLLLSLSVYASLALVKSDSSVTRPSESVIGIPLSSGVGDPRTSKELTSEVASLKFSS